ncbi:hypothetical protein HELRODRAFT_66676 [Helobdella robusta]|uniref:GOST seven transmembrane domain-containing protein n=1 Tax=Helobdella robusta TaxID=6412 RepID=T1FYN8_HELRO|nr:hypothetical protein HELRODRAFT_66676 [Helobdella robusta]ESN99155.1 hypothetical protein HELRODRAFT_66676 [Helobdella robusta]
MESLILHDRSALLTTGNNINYPINVSTQNASSLPAFNFSHVENEHITQLRLLRNVDSDSYLLSFEVIISNSSEAGLYTLTFHNCDRRGLVNLTVDIIEKNNDRFLTVGDMPLPYMYYAFFAVSLFLSGLWLFILCRSKEEVFKMHYLMFVLMLIKSISLLFHGINYHFIDVHGEKEETFAILFYIIYLIRGILMFVTIILIGAGWTFVKHILSEKEKKIFVIVIPLQILTNVAHIIMFESEEGETNYNIWYHVFILVDLACCGAILFPVVWSIRHLQQASSTDGKATINLEKLKIFRHFYMLVVFYIYFTRVIILLLTYTIPFKYTWIGELLVESSTICFFVITAYKFRPASKNPYLLVSSSDDEGEIEILTKSGALETVSKIRYKNKKSKSDVEQVVLIERDGENEL